MVSYQWAKVEAFQTFQEGLAEHSSIKAKLILERSRISHCGEPEDKVYGILGLLDPKLAKQVTIDYAKPISHTYPAFVRAWIDAENNLDVLLECGDEHAEELRHGDMPSWVPDLQRCKRMLTSAIEPDCKAHGKTNACVSFSADGQVLAAQGILFDVVVGVSDIFRIVQDDRLSINDEDDPMHNRRQGESAGPGLRASAYGDWTRTAEALWRAMLGNRDLSGQALSNHYACILSAGILNNNARYLPTRGGSYATMIYEMRSFLAQSSPFVICGRELHRYFTHVKIREDDQV